MKLNLMPLVEGYRQSFESDRKLESASFKPRIRMYEWIQTWLEKLLTNRSEELIH